jgi:hypothetical protein
LQIVPGLSYLAHDQRHSHPVEMEKRKKIKQILPVPGSIEKPLLKRSVETSYILTSGLSSSPNLSQWKETSTNRSSFTLPPIISTPLQIPENDPIDKRQKMESLSEEELKSSGSSSSSMTTKTVDNLELADFTPNLTSSSTQTLPSLCNTPLMTNVPDNADIIDANVVTCDIC